MICEALRLCALQARVTSIMKKTAPLISLILPAHNEEEALKAGFLERALQTEELLPKHIPQSPQSGRALEIIAVNDGSTDDTRALLEKFKGRIQIIHWDKRRGYGAALKAGFSKAAGDYIAFLDMDSTCKCEDLPLLLRPIVDKGAKAVIGGRLGKGSRMPAIRAIGNRLFSWALLLLSGRYVRDPCSGYRLFEESLYPKTLKLPQDLSFSMAFTAMLIREKIPFEEVRISYKERSGRSKLQPVKDGLLFLKAMFQALRKP